MSANTRKYEDYLEYLPEKEREAAEEALYAKESEEGMAMAIIRQVNRQNQNTGRPGKGRRNLLEQY